MSYINIFTRQLKQQSAANDTAAVKHTATFQL